MTRGKTTVVPLARSQITIGRDEDNTIRLTERNVSRRHARLERLNGGYTVADLGSYNGVRINGVKIERRSRLEAGDRITIGDYLLRFQFATTDSQAPIAAGFENEPTNPELEKTRVSVPVKRSEPDIPPRLVMISEPYPGAEYALGEPRTRIGRAEEIAIWVNDASISREHAEVINEPDGFRIVDLESANGMRLNGKDTKTATLRPGDVVELGRVRFRYVPAGEKFSLDVDRTILMDEPFEESSQAPLIAMIAVIVLGGLAGAYFYFDRARDEGEVEAIRDIEPIEAPPEFERVIDEPKLRSEVDLDRVVAKCRLAIEDQLYDEAIKAADSVLGVSPSHADASACRRTAETRRKDALNFSRGTLALNEGDGVGAYEAFRQLSQESPYFDQPVIEQAAKLFARTQLDRAYAMLEVASNRQDFANVRSAARKVLDMPDVLPKWQTEAQAIIAKVNDAERATRRPRGRTFDSRPPVSARSSGSIEQQCAQAGGNIDECIVDRLRGRAGSPAELLLLIEAYGRLGRRRDRLREMQRFVDRYPNDLRARSFGQVLAREGL